jgi:hypothetical protein
VRKRRCETRPRSLTSAAYEAVVFKVSSASMDLLAPHAADIIYARKRTTEVVEITHSDS